MSNPWKEAIDNQLVLMESTADSFDTPEAAINALLDWHVAVASDPRCNGRGNEIDKDKLTTALLSASTLKPASNFGVGWVEAHKGLLEEVEAGRFNYVIVDDLEI